MIMVEFVTVVVGTWLGRICIVSLIISVFIGSRLAWQILNADDMDDHNPAVERACKWCIVSFTFTAVFFVALLAEHQHHIH